MGRECVFAFWPRGKERTEKTPLPLIRKTVYIFYICKRAQNIENLNPVSSPALPTDTHIHTYTHTKTRKRVAYNNCFLNFSLYSIKLVCDSGCVSVLNLLKYITLRNIG